MSRHCRAALVADLIALTDGVVLDDPRECDDPPTWTVIFRRDTADFRLSLDVAVCASHDLLMQDVDGYTRRTHIQT